MSFFIFKGFGNEVGWGEWVGKKERRWWWKCKGVSVFIVINKVLLLKNLNLGIDGEEDERKDRRIILKVIERIGISINFVRVSVICVYVCGW